MLGPLWWVVQVCLVLLLAPTGSLLIQPALGRLAYRAEG